MVIVLFLGFFSDFSKFFIISVYHICGQNENQKKKMSSVYSKDASRHIRNRWLFKKGIFGGGECSVGCCREDRLGEGGLAALGAQGLPLQQKWVWNPDNTRRAVGGKQKEHLKDLSLISSATKS